MPDNQISTTSLEVGQVGSTSIRIPVTTLGAGAPRLALLCGIHGDETASFIICREFIRRVGPAGGLTGSVSVVAGVNQLALSARTRVSATDYLDMNRVGKGSPDGVLTERAADTVFNFLHSCALVVDIHEFVMDTPLMAIYTPSRDTEVDRTILRSISAFNPATVWALGLGKPHEAKFSTTLIAALIEHGTPGFIVETSRAAVLSDEDIQRAVDGLVAVSRGAGVLEGNAELTTPPAFERDVRYADSSGVWTPTANLMSRVRAGDKIGELTSADLTAQADVLAHSGGTLIQLRGRDFVDTGTSLFTVGLESAEVSAKFHRVASA